MVGPQEILRKRELAAEVQSGSLMGCRQTRFGCGDYAICKPRGVLRKRLEGCPIRDRVQVDGARKVARLRSHVRDVDDRIFPEPGGGPTARENGLVPPARALGSPGSFDLAPPI